MSDVDVTFGHTEVEVSFEDGTSVPVTFGDSFDIAVQFSSGPTGPSGPAGAGMPDGGDTGAIAIKASADDYDFTTTKTLEDPGLIIDGGLI